MAQKEGFQTETPILTLPEEPWTGRLAVKNILCPVDFSEFSLQAFRCAVGIARHFQARLFVQHTVHVSAAMFLEGTDITTAREAIQLSRHDADRRLRGLIAESGAQESEVFTLINEGDVRDHILETVAEQKIDLLVMGTHGHKGFNRLVLGSVAEHLVHEAVCPVLVVSRPESGFVTLEDAEPVHLKTIVAATDFSPNSSRALIHALRWASEWSGKVILFHAVEETSSDFRRYFDLLPEYNPYFEKQVAEGWEKIRTVIPEAARAKCELSYEVRQGHPKEEILKYAAEKKPDLIVMGARGVGRSDVVWGSTISGVVRDGRFPVLSVRHLLDESREGRWQTASGRVEVGGQEAKQAPPAGRARYVEWASGRRMKPPAARPALVPSE